MSRTKVDLIIKNIEPEGVHIFIDAEINNYPVKLLVDTGASRCVFDKNSVEELFDNHKIDKSEELSIVLGTDSMESMTTVFSSLKIGELEIENFETVVLDLSHVNQSYEALEFEKIFGVIGGDFLKKFNAIINFKSKKLRIDSK